VEQPISAAIAMVFSSSLLMCCLPTGDGGDEEAIIDGIPAVRLPERGARVLFRCAAVGGECD
jgi:hypothetical protein